MAVFRGQQPLRAGRQPPGWGWESLTLTAAPQAQRPRSDHGPKRGLQGGAPCGASGSGRGGVGEHPEEGETPWEAGQGLATWSWSAVGTSRPPGEKEGQRRKAGGVPGGRPAWRSARGGGPTSPSATEAAGGVVAEKAPAGVGLILGFQRAFPRRLESGQGLWRPSPTQRPGGAAVDPRDCGRSPGGCDRWGGGGPQGSPR